MLKFIWQIIGSFASKCPTNQVSDSYQYSPSSKLPELETCSLFNRTKQHDILEDDQDLTEAIQMILKKQDDDAEKRIDLPPKN